MVIETQHSQKLFTLISEPFKKPSQDLNNYSLEQFYHLARTKVFTYRMIFIGLGILFLVLSGIIYFKTPNWNFTLLFGHGHLAKMFVSGLSFSLGIFSLLAGCSMRTEKEIVRMVCVKTKQVLRTMHERVSGDEYLQAFIQACENVDLHRNFALKKVNEIANRRISDAEKEQLFKEAIQELRQHLQNETKEFKS